MPSEDGVAIDQILITDDLEYYPSGIVSRPGAEAETPSGTSSGEQSGHRPDPRPFLAAVGGHYRSGFESVLVRLGIPSVRLLDGELDKPEMLSRYDLVCLSFKVEDLSNMVPARNSGVDENPVVSR